MNIKTRVRQRQIRVKLKLLDLKWLIREAMIKPGVDQYDERIIDMIGSDRVFADELASGMGYDGSYSEDILKFRHDNQDNCRRLAC